jgi:hypothetical protein
MPVPTWQSRDTHEVEPRHTVARPAMLSDKKLPPPLVQPAPARSTHQSATWAGPAADIPRPRTRALPG